MKDGVTLYNNEKHRLPCWNCLVRPTCFTEKKATKRAKYLRYTLWLKNPCIESALVMDLIQLAASDQLITSLSRMEELDTLNLFETAITYFHSGAGEFVATAYVMFINIVHRNAKYIWEDYDTAYYYLGNIYNLYFKKIDFAIDLYSKGIELTTKDPSIFENRGFCYLEKNDIVNALNDFKKAKEINGGTHSDLDKIIDEIENR